MKAVILAAGEGKRMRPLTESVPKPMLLVAGRPLLEHLLAELPESVDEVVLVVGYLARQIREHFGEKFGRFRIHYVHQEEKRGTAEALLLCKHLLLGERFMTLYADDLHARTDFEEMLKYPLSVLVKEVENPERFGVVVRNEHGLAVRIIEKPNQPESTLVLTGPAVLDDRIFNYPPHAHPNGEYYLADAIGELVKAHEVSAVNASFWFPIGYPEDLARAEKFLLEKLNAQK